MSQTLTYKARRFSAKEISNRLEIIGIFFVDKNNNFPILPKVIEINSRVYFRYMDRLFSPIPISELNPTQSKMLCEIRIDYFSEIVDDKYNLKTINCLSDNIFSVGKEYIQILDFGCGNGVYTKELLYQFPKANIIGADISLKSIHKAMKIEDINWIYIDELCQLPLEDNSVDYIISMFVMHFNINAKLLKELYRVMNQEGAFVFNIFNKKYLSTNFYEKMDDAGFKLKVIDNCDLSSNNINMCAEKK